MHISIYDTQHTIFHRKGIIMLDGREVDRVIEASEEKGFLVRYKDDFINSLNSPTMCTERLTGKVEIKLPPEYDEGDWREDFKDEI